MLLKWSVIEGFLVIDLFDLRFVHMIAAAGHHHSML